VKSSFKNNSQFKVDKSKEVIEILKSIVKKGLSPSAITSFMINPLQFYYQRVLKIRELGKLFPVIEPRDKGNVVHETLESIYKPFVSKELVVRNYDSMIKKLPVVLDEKYKLIYGGNPERKGHNYLIYEELKKQCEEFLLTERLLIEKGNKLKILSLEKKIEYDLDFKELLFPVKIIGTIDRVDEWNGKLRISDYKTGSVKKNKLKFSSNFTFEGLESQKSLENSSLFQLLLYSYVYSKQNSHEGIKTGIIPIKTPKDYFYPVTISSDKENKDLLLINTFNQFEKELIAVIKKLFNENIAFIANDSE
jgi:ATP-dependent helicase/DNAse subunit B